MMSGWEVNGETAVAMKSSAFRGPAHRGIHALPGAAIVRQRARAAWCKKLPKAGPYPSTARRWLAYSENHGTVPFLGRVRQAMDVKLKPFDFAQAAARAGLRTDGLPLTGKPGKVEGGPSFSVAMSEALKSVSAQQTDAARMQREVQLDNPTVGLEETMVAMTRANLGFSAALQVRNRLVQAYSEIMNMQV